MQLTWSLLRSPVTALCLLEDFVKLQPGDIVVQNGAAGSVGKVSSCWSDFGSFCHLQSASAVCIFPLHLGLTICGHRVMWEHSCMQLSPEAEIWDRASSRSLKRLADCRP